MKISTEAGAFVASGEEAANWFELLRVLVPPAALFVAWESRDDFGRMRGGNSLLVRGYQAMSKLTDTARIMTDLRSMKLSDYFSLPGTGSYPAPPHGLHRMIRLSESQRPAIAP